jgi:hypothetical protein
MKVAVRMEAKQNPGKVNLAQNVTKLFEETLSWKHIWLKFMGMSNSIIVKFVAKDSS